MGQYWNAVVGNVTYGPLGGHARIMEHSWIGSGFVRGVAALIAHNPQEVFWVGDYCDDVLDQITDKTLNEKVVTAMKAPNIFETNPELNKRYDQIVRYRFKGIEKYFAELDKLEIEQFGKVTLPNMTTGYLVNHTKREIVDLAVYVRSVGDANGWCVNPLPLLTAVPNGNGLDGGDYFGDSPYLARWCGDVISYETKMDKEVTAGYTTLSDVNF